MTDKKAIRARNSVLYLVGVLFLLVGAMKLGQYIADDLFGKDTHISVHGVIEPGSAEKFKRALLKANFSLSKRSVIHIESPGGWVVSQLKMIHYVLNANHQTLCYVDSHAASSAANLLMTCNKIYVAPGAELTFHVAQHCTKVSGDGKSCLEQVPTTLLFGAAAYKQSISFLEIFLKPYISESKWRQLQASQDVSLTGAELMLALPEHRKASYQEVFGG